MEYLDSVDQVLNALGPRAVQIAERYGLKRSAVTNWRSRGQIPARLYELMLADLAKQRMFASPHIWGIEPCHAPQPQTKPSGKPGAPSNGKRR